MAKKTGVSIRQSVYKTFRGADFSTDPSLVDYSRSPLCTNIVADGGGMPQKRLGWRKLWQKDKPVYGLFAGRFDGAEKKLAHIGTALYAWDDETAPTEILTGLPERRSRAAYLAGKLWIVTGAGFYVYDGTAAHRASQNAYIPTTVITRSPTGGGQSYENVNMLTPYRKNAFQTDGTATDFQLDGDIDATGTVRAWVFGEETTAFTLDREKGIIKMTTAPAKPTAGSEDGLVVEFPHTVAGYTDRIDKCTIITTYGIGTNDRAVLSGNEELPNVDWTSGMNDPTYFPDLLYNEVGSEATAILGYCRLGRSLGIVKEDNGQDSTIYLRTAELQDSEIAQPQQQAVAGVGSIAPGSFASLLDDPLFLSRNGVMAVTTNSYTSEKITQGRSFYVNNKLNDEPEREKAEAVIWNGMYMLALPNGHVYALDGRQNKTYRSAALGDYVYEGYYFENIPASCWLNRRAGAEESLYFGTADGRICKLNTDIEDMSRYSDDGAAISAVWATKYDDDGTPAVLKALMADRSLKRLELDVMPYEKERTARIAPIVEGCVLRGEEMVRVLNWERVLDALMRLRARSGRMLDGEAALEIDGERLTLRAENNLTAVERGGRSAELVLTGREAVQLLMGMEGALCADARMLNWLPLPLHISGADTF